MGDAGDDDGAVVRVEDPHLGRVVVPADELAARVAEPPRAARRCGSGC